MVAPIVLVPLFAILIHRNASRAGEPDASDQPVGSLGVRLFFLAATFLVGAFIPAVDGLGLEIPMRWIQAFTALCMIVLGLTFKTPDPAQTPAAPTARWFAERWRWGYFGLTGSSLLVNLLAPHPAFANMLLVFSVFAMPGETWGRRPAQ